MGNSCLQSRLEKPSLPVPTVDTLVKAGFQAGEPRYARERMAYVC